VLLVDDLAGGQGHGTNAAPVKATLRHITIATVLCSSSSSIEVVRVVIHQQCSVTMFSQSAAN
jgi:hypothetical protein